MQNQLTDKANMMKPTNDGNMMPLTLNANGGNCGNGNMNASFDNGSSGSNGVSMGLNMNVNNKKIRIPKLNL